MRAQEVKILVLRYLFDVVDDVHFGESATFSGAVPDLSG